MTAQWIDVRKKVCGKCGALWNEENVYLNHYNSPARRNCRMLAYKRHVDRVKAGAPLVRQQRGSACEAKPVSIDHTRCEPPDDLCDECLVIWQCVDTGAKRG